MTRMTSNQVRIAAPLNGLIEDTGSLFRIGQWADEGGQSGSARYIAPLHVHHQDDEIWYVLEGTLRFRLGRDELEAPAGSAVLGPKGVPHTFWNPRPEPARYLIVMTANTARLFGEFQALPDRDATTVRELFRRYNCELLG